MVKLHAAIEELHNKQHPYFRQQIKTAFAVIENGPDTTDYIVKIFISPKENDDLTKLIANNYRLSCRDAAHHNCIGCGYSVVDLTDHLARYYSELV